MRSPRSPAAPSKDDIIGKKVKKHFPGAGWCIGAVEKYDQPWYHIKYMDGDEEDVSRETALKLIRKYKADEELAS